MIVIMIGTCHGLQFPMGNCNVPIGIAMDDWVIVHSIMSSDTEYINIFLLEEVSGLPTVVSDDENSL